MMGRNAQALEMAATAASSAGTVRSLDVINGLEVTNNDDKFTAIFKSGIVKFLKIREAQQRKTGAGPSYSVQGMPDDDYKRLKRSVQEEVMKMVSEIPREVREVLGNAENEHFRNFVARHRYSDELVWMDYTKYGLDCWRIMVELINTKDIPEYWEVLQLVFMRLPAPVALKLLRGEAGDDYDRINNYSPAQLDSVAQTLVEGSASPIATALEVAQYFYEMASVHLAVATKYVELRDKYSDVALELLNNVESDHGAALLLEAPSDGDAPGSGDSALKVALATENYTFIADSRLVRLVNTMWWDPLYMHPKRCLFQNVIPPVSSQLLPPRQFFDTPLGKFWAYAILFFLYVSAFTWITIDRPCVYSRILFVEWPFWFANIAYVLQETGQILAKGVPEYFGELMNVLDFTIITQFMILGGIRATAWRFDADKASKDCSEFEDEPQNVIYKTLWSVNIILMWSRLCFLFVMHQTIGPLLRMIQKMVVDIRNFIVILFLFYFGFQMAFYYYVGDLAEPFNKISSAVLTIFEATVGVVEWKEDFKSRVDDPDYIDLGGINKDNEEELGKLPELGQFRQSSGKILLALYMIIGFVMLLNLLIAMMSQTYSSVQENSKKEYQFGRAANIYDFHRETTILPAPLNLVVFLLYTPWFLVDMARPKAVEYTTSDSLRSDPDVKPKMVWICGYCHAENRVGDSENVLAGWLMVLHKDEKIDEMDIPVVQGSKATICKKCFHVYKPISRHIMNMEQLSFWVFLVTAYPILGILIGVLPGIFNMIVRRLKRRVSNRENATRDDSLEAEFRKEQALELGDLGAERRDQAAANIRKIFRGLGEVDSAKMLENLNHIRSVLDDVQGRLQRKERRRKKKTVTTD